MKLLFLLLVVCASLVNAGLLNEAKNYAKWELEHQAMKHILPESLGGKSSHHHSQEVVNGGGMGSGGSGSGSMAGMLGRK